MKGCFICSYLMAKIHVQSFYTALFIARRQSFTSIYPSWPLHRTTLVPAFRWFAIIPQATPFTDEVCETKLEERKVVRRKTWKSFFALLATILQVSTCHLYAWGPCVGACRTMALIGDAMQATGERKSGLVETRTNRTGGYGPAYIS